MYYDVVVKAPTTVKQLSRYLDEYSIALKIPCKPIVKILHDQGKVRLEFFKKVNLFKNFWSINECAPGNMEIPILLGEKSDNSPIWLDLSKAPHILIGGTTGSGKSISIHCIIANLFKYSPESEIHIIDTKAIDFIGYKHLCKVNTSYAEALKTSSDFTSEMNSRYRQLSLGKVSYPSLKPLILIIDECSDLFMQDQDKSLYNNIMMLAQKARAAKIHIILATQRPSASIINGNIKANFSTRLAFRTFSSVDSRVILDSNGAENLLGNGDGIIHSNNYFYTRYQSFYCGLQDNIYRRVCTRI